MPANTKSTSSQVPTSPAGKNIAKYTNKDGSKYITVPKSSNPTNPTSPTNPTPTSPQQPVPPTSPDSAAPAMPAPQPSVLGTNNGPPTGVNPKKQKRRQKMAAKAAAAAANGVGHASPSPTSDAPAPTNGQLPPETDDADADVSTKAVHGSPAASVTSHNGSNDNDAGDAAAAAANPQAAAKKAKKRRKKRNADAGAGAGAGAPNIQQAGGVQYGQEAIPRPRPDDRVWSTNSQEERGRIKKFWLTLAESERRDLVRLEKETLLRKMKEQQRNTCSCAVCGRKRSAIEQELENIYESYYKELEVYTSRPDVSMSSTPTNHALRPPRTTPTINYQAQGQTQVQVQVKGRIVEHVHDDDDDDDDVEEEASYGDEEYDEDDDYSDDDLSDDVHGTHDAVEKEFAEFGKSLTVKGGILTVADDLLSNNGRKFIEIMEQIADSRMPRESGPSHYGRSMAHGPNGTYAGHTHHELDHDHHPGMHEDLDPHPEDEPEFDDEEEDDYDDSQEDGYEEDDDDAEGAMTDQQRMEEGRRMFQLFAARMFEQRLLSAYKEKLATERSQRLIQECAVEDAQKELIKQQKAAKAQKKREKERQKKEQMREAKARKEAERKEAEEKARKEAEAKRAEDQKKAEEKRKDQKRKEDEERQRKEAARIQRQQEHDRKAREKKLKEEQRQQEAREAKEKKEREEREAREQKERESRERKEKHEAAERERKAKEAKAKADREAKEQKQTIAKAKGAAQAAIPKTPAASKRPPKQQAQQQPASQQQPRQPSLPKQQEKHEKPQATPVPVPVPVPVPAPAPAPAPAPSAIPTHTVPATKFASPKIAVATPIVHPIRSRTSSQQHAQQPHQQGQQADANSSAPSVSTSRQASGTGPVPSHSASPDGPFPMHASPGAGGVPSGQQIPTGPSAMQQHQLQQHQHQLPQSASPSVSSLPGSMGTPPPGFMTGRNPIPGHSQGFQPGPQGPTLLGGPSQYMGPIRTSGSYGYTGEFMPPAGGVYMAPPPGFSQHSQHQPTEPSLAIPPGFGPQSDVTSHGHQARPFSGALEGMAPGLAISPSQPINRPAPIGRPGSIVHGQSSSSSNSTRPADNQDDESNQHLGSRALLDDAPEDAIAIGLGQRQRTSAPGLPPPGMRPQFPGSVPFEAPFTGFPTWPSPSNMSNVNMAFNSASGTGLGGSPWAPAPAQFPPPPMAPVAAPGGASKSRHMLQLRIMLSDVCQRMSRAGPFQGGYVDFNEAREQISAASQLNVAEEELLAISETEGNAHNGDGTFESTWGPNGERLIRWQQPSAAETGSHHPPGAPGQIGSPVIGSGAPRGS